MPKEGALSLKVLTYEGVAVTDDAVAIRVPGEMGSFGILKNHAPLISTLKPGLLLWRSSSNESRSLRLGDGLIEVCRNQVTILTHSIAQQNSEDLKQ